ncbi:putative ATPase [Streptoalloteichus tenebrarius]|uniref:ATPase n=1 Tax=Streptoalloteichus tenebrarius (strain ATCC 17920 / DSM 40477 / JCM 4838 / CBS 697.72 / NBRC 16177 / NCIMB 11028 / NRRL B-12390 / A12253. 1 / ISP 5477) TaxID=1933 RepID=A0ABT1HUI1_STRSD|nr:BTAD domain-containing putative transcriptional regulator [Streptoalloteichus tenebrarius]MCP2259188.1 putative ATPase [Streptoalloteichus tenebrarius]
MWFGVLGPVEVHSSEGVALPVGGPRARSLLALLALDAGRVVAVERLVDGLYGERPPADAANALQAQVSRLRRRLRDGGYPGELVEFHPAGYRLAVDPEDVDLHRFTRLTEDGRAASASGEHARSASLLRRALDLWRGPALADVRDAPFAEVEAVRLAELRLSAVEDHAEAALASGEHRALVPDLQAAVAEHPLRERLRVLLMRALHAAGRTADALAVFEDARRTLADALGADPSPELAAAHLAVLRAEPSTGPPAGRTAGRPAERPTEQSAERPTSRLQPPAPAGEPTRPRGVPAQLTSFVGRTAELDRIGALLRRARLVTLLGPGGAGKTRLAVEVAGRVRDEVCFVDLAPVAGGAELPQAVLDALGLREVGLMPAPGGPSDPVARLVSALASRPLLMVLDNCEHVVADVAQLVHRLLGACPDLRVLATSREALGITGEALCPLPPLAVPPSGVSPDEALTYPSVRLFADRAAGVSPLFTVDDENVRGVLRICSALDGLPLAIELAAARLRTLSVDEIADRLADVGGRDDHQEAAGDAPPPDRFRLLSRGSRTASPRHRTLRAVVEWSWNLLALEERALARRLTVFDGGATLDSAASVCDLSIEDAEDLLAGLVDKSLVEVVDGRYRMLDTIRAFCAAHLEAAGERRRLRARHAEHFLDLARTADPHLRRAEQLVWMERLSAEHGNLKGALRWAVREDPTTALHLISALTAYWRLRGVRSEVAPLATALLDRIGERPQDGMVEEYVLCVLAAAAGDDPNQKLEPHLARVITLMETTSWPVRQPYLMVNWALFVGPPEERVTDSPLGAWFLANPDPWFRALSHFSLSYLRLFGSDLDAAEREFGEALAAFREVGDRWGVAQVLDGLATLAALRGEWARALALTDEAITRVTELGAFEELAELRCRRGDRLLGAGDLTGALAEYDRSAELARRVGVPATLAYAHRGRGEVARRRGDLATARSWYDRALAVPSTDWASAGARSHVLTSLGRLAEDTGDLAAARARHRAAVEIALGQRFLPDLASVTEGMAGAVASAGDGERAALLLGVAVTLRGAADADPEVARTAERARELVGADGFASAFAEGSLMPRDEALALLREMVERE